LKLAKSDIDLATLANCHDCEKSKPVAEKGDGSVPPVGQAAPGISERHGAPYGRFDVKRCSLTPLAYPDTFTKAATLAGNVAFFPRIAYPAHPVIGAVAHAS
jgi:hypothetical protein